MNRLFLEVKDCRRYGFRGTASLGLENIFQDDGWQGVGKLSKLIKKNRKFNKKVSGLLIDSHRLSREVPESLFERFSGLRVLGLFNPTFEAIPSTFSTLQQLNVLVIRDCPFLNNVDKIEELRNLIVLEITGATLLNKMPEALFKNMSRLRGISISAANITSIPEISGQLELRRVILRDCSRLEKVPLIPKCKDFELLDVSGCISLNEFEDKTFQEFVELQFLDVSNTQLNALPLFNKSLKKLNRLLLSDTPIPRFRFLDGITGLEIIDISNSKVVKDLNENVFTDKTALRVIDFSGTQIVSFRSTSTIEKLESINLSNNPVFRRFEDASLDHLKYLHVLNVSNTNIQKLPNLTDLPNLCHLLLKDCPKLKELGKMEGLVKLEKIDLSNAKVLETIQQLGQDNLRSVLLQGCEKLQGLPPFTNVTKLEELDLSGCGKLQKLPSLADATKLKKLDLSGCGSLTEIEDLSFDHFIELEILKLSRTGICKLPSLLNLGNLEELDLSGNNNLEAFEGDQFLQHTKHLQILNLSGIPQVTLAPMSCLSKLKQLILHGCTNLDQVVDLEKLTALEILDLSQTKISSLPPLKSFINLKKLLLRNSHSIEEVKDLKCVSKLEVLDLFGTGLKEFPYEISDLAWLHELYLPEIKGCHVDWGQIKWLPEKVNIEECGIFNATETNTGNSNGELSITVTSTKLFELFKKFQYSWETYFTKFQISVCSPDYIADNDPLLSGPDAGIFRDIYTIHTTKSIDHHHTRCLDIRGFDDTILGSLDDVLRYAEYVSITDSKLNKSLHNLGGDNTKRLWIERCNEMVNVFHVEKQSRDARLMAGLEVLCVSNMTKLENILYANEVMHKASFNSLKEMHLDCCPELDSLFTSDKAPENIEIIDIKFCDKLTTVFGKICEMPKLRTLRLFQLPKLKTIGDKLKSAENLHTIRIEYCDTLKTFSNETGLALPSLRKLHLESLPSLESIGRVPASPSVLEKYVEECPQLKLA